jgi:hypothetical protein
VGGRSPIGHKEEEGSFNFPPLFIFPMILASWLVYFTAILGDNRDIGQSDIERSLKMLVVKIAIIIQVVLYCQPDAKIANGMYWADFWLNLVQRFVG